MCNTLYCGSRPGWDRCIPMTIDKQDCEVRWSVYVPYGPSLACLLPIAWELVRDDVSRTEIPWVGTMAWKCSIRRLTGEVGGVSGLLPFPFKLRFARAIPRATLGPANELATLTWDCESTDDC